MAIVTILNESKVQPVLPWSLWYLFSIFAIFAIYTAVYTSQVLNEDKVIVTNHIISYNDFELQLPEELLKRTFIAGVKWPTMGPVNTGTTIYLLQLIIFSCESFSSYEIITHCFEKRITFV